MTDDAINFFKTQDFAVVSTIDEDGGVHCSCKDIVKIDPHGRFFLLDLYKGVTFANIMRNPVISITAVDGHKFKGYCLKGKASIVDKDKLGPDILPAWDAKVVSRITHRLLKNIKGEKGHPTHPEAGLPKPQYMIVVDVEEEVDLTPKHLKQLRDKNG